MLVIRPMSGAAMPASRAISPGELVPISRIAASCSSERARRASGIPIRLFRFPGLHSTRRDRDRRQESISFVVVFPELPVMATRGTCRWRRRCARARSPSASTGSRTTKTGRVRASAAGTFFDPASETIAASAPFSNTSSTKSAPSTRSPGRATKTDFGPTSRLSVVTTPIGSGTESPAASRSGWIAPITSGSVILPPLGEHIPDDPPVVERQAPVPDDLDILVSFPDDRDRVPFLPRGTRPRRSPLSCRSPPCSTRRPTPPARGPPRTPRSSAPGGSPR